MLGGRGGRRKTRLTLCLRDSNLGVNRGPVHFCKGACEERPPGEGLGCVLHGEEGCLALGHREDKVGTVGFGCPQGPTNVSGNSGEVASHTVQFRKGKELQRRPSRSQDVELRRRGLSHQ